MLHQSFLLLSSTFHSIYLFLHVLLLFCVFFFVFLITPIRHLHGSRCKKRCSSLTKLAYYKIRFVTKKDLAWMDKTIPRVVKELLGEKWLYTMKPTHYFASFMRYCICCMENKIVTSRGFWGSRNNFSLPQPCCLHDN